MEKIKTKIFVMRKMISKPGVEVEVWFELDFNRVRIQECEELFGFEPDFDCQTFEVLRYIQTLYGK